VNGASWRVAYRGLMPDDVVAGLSVPDRERFWSDTPSGGDGRRPEVMTLSQALSRTAPRF
jgi:hypothetical protein